MSHEIAAFRFYRNIGRVGDGRGYSRKLSIKWIVEPRDIWLGVYWDWRSKSEWFVYIGLLPCLPIRLHLIRAYGGVYPEACA